MIPIEIYLLKQQSYKLQHALMTDKIAVWHFLYKHVQSRLGYYPQGEHHCERCGKTTYPTLKSPYNDFHPGWCIECVLDAFYAHNQTYPSDESIEPHSTDSWYVMYQVLTSR